MTICRLPLNKTPISQNGEIDPPLHYKPKPQNFNMPLKRIPTPTQDAGNWGTILNDHLSQTQNPLNGAFNSFDQFSARPTNLTLDDVGRTYLYSQTGNWHEWSGSEWKVQNKSEINVKDYGAIGDGVVDDTAALQLSIDTASYLSGTYNASKTNNVFVPNGKYRVANTLNLTSVVPNARMSFTIEFQTRSDEFAFGTLFIGETGDKPVIETTGTSCITLINVGIKAGVNNPSTLGILQARPAGNYGGAFRHKYSSLFIYLGSNTTANNGFGTIGIINVSGEECEYESIELWANTCFITSYTNGFRISNLDTPTFKSYTAVSAFGIPLTTGESNTVYKFSGSNRFASFDYVSPAILINVCADFNLGTTYISKRDSGTARIGNYSFAVENWNCINFYHRGDIEGCENYMLLRRELVQADIAVNMYSIGPISNSAMIQCWDDGAQYSIRDSYISIIANITNTSPLIDFRSFTGQLTSGFSVKNTTFKYSKDYSTASIGASIIDKSYNSEYLFGDKSIRFLENKQIRSENSIPIIGTYKVGDKVYNTTPSAGGYEGWLCTTAGTPGTWKGFGLIES